MRKSLLYVFAVICTMGFFTACGDDDDSSSSGNWQDLSKTYEGKSVNLVMGEVTVPVDGKSVVIAASSAEKASVTLNNIVGRYRCRVEGSGWHLYVYRREYGWRLRGISKWYGERGRSFCCLYS